MILLKPFLILIVTTVCSADFLFGRKQTVWEILTEDKQFTTLVQEIENAQITDVFKKIDYGTVFAPTNKAFEENYAYYSKRTTTKEQLLYHIITIQVGTDDLWEGRLLDTKATIDKVSQRLRVTKNKSGLFLGVGGDQDQSRIVQPNIQATNGIVHGIDTLISLPVYLDEALHANRDTQDFYNKSSIARITQDLKSATGITVFVAKGDQFGDHLNPFEKHYLSLPGGRKDLSRLLNHQVVNGIHYGDAFEEGKTIIETAEGSEDLEIAVANKKGAPSTILVNGVKVAYNDILAANGVIHVLEGPIFPINKNFLKLTARKALTGLNSTRFIKLFDDNDLGAYLDNDQNELSTILAPSDDALDAMEIMSANDIKTWLLYHMVHGRWTPSDLKDGQLLETESHDGLANAYQRIDVHITDSRQPIQFGKSGVVGDPVFVRDHLVIYPLAESLVLPRDPLSRLPVNLQLSTFVASLYASGRDRDIAKAHEVTLFAPTNEAFARLGLLSKYLLQPEAKEQLGLVASYHAVHGLFYYNLTAEGDHREPTLASGAEINLNKTSHGFYVRGSGAVDGDDRNVIAKVTEADILTSNGVIHVIDRVELPSSLKVTNGNLLSAEGTSSFLKLLKRTDLAKDVLDHLDPEKAYTILAPSDRAFGKLNLTHLLEDRDRLLRIAKLHILPVQLPNLDPHEATSAFRIYSGLQDRGHKNIGYSGADFPTLLSEDSRVTITHNLENGYSITVKGSSAQEGADVINYGRASNGGGVIEIDRVLIPKGDYEGYTNNWAWWEIVLVALGSLVGLSLLLMGAYVGWRYYQSRREGHHRLPEDQ